MKIITETVYVVCERSFQYNDEIYHLPDEAENSGVPQKVFKTLKQAEEVKLHNNIEWLKNTELNSYTYSQGEELFGYKSAKEIMQKLDIHIDTKMSKLDNNKLIEILSHIKIAPWIICKVELQ